MKRIIFTILLLLTLIPMAQADWVKTPNSGTVTEVRTYGLRDQITVSGTSHDCGVQATVFYFDSDKIPIEVVKAVLSLAFGAMIAEKSVNITYDCNPSANGYGISVAMSVSP